MPVRVLTLSWLTLLVVMSTAGLSVHAATEDAKAEPRVIHLEALNVGDEYWFKVKGKTTQNPELGFLPGEQVEVHLDSKGHVAHNLRFAAPIDEALPLLSPGETDVLRFTVPSDAEGTTRYWCDPHKDLGMIGTVSFGEVKAGPRIEAPGPSVPALLLALGLASYLFAARLR